MRHARVLASIRHQNITTTARSHGGDRGLFGIVPSDDDAARANGRHAQSRRFSCRIGTSGMRRSSPSQARLHIGSRSGEAVPLALLPAALATLLAVSVAAGAEVAAYPPSRYSIAESVPPAAAPTYTLLDPNWLLPPVEALDTERTGQMLRDDAGVEPARQRPGSSAGPLAYSLSDDLT